jgi:hypothetical protein
MFGVDDKLPVGKPIFSEWVVNIRSNNHLWICKPIKRTPNQFPNRAPRTIGTNNIIPRDSNLLPAEITHNGRAFRILFNPHDLVFPQHLGQLRERRQASQDNLGHLMLSTQDGRKPLHQARVEIRDELIVDCYPSQDKFVVGRLHVDFSTLGSDPSALEFNDCGGAVCHCPGRLNDLGILLEQD